MRSAFWWNRMHRHENLIFGDLPPDDMDAPALVIDGQAWAMGWSHVVLNVNDTITYSIKCTEVRCERTSRSASSAKKKGSQSRSPSESESTVRERRSRRAKAQRARRKKSATSRAS